MIREGPVFVYIVKPSYSLLPPRVSTTYPSGVLHLSYPLFLSSTSSCYLWRLVPQIKTHCGYAIDVLFGFYTYIGQKLRLFCHLYMYLYLYILVLRHRRECTDVWWLLQLSSSQSLLLLIDCLIYFLGNLVVMSDIAWPTFLIKYKKRI